MASNASVDGESGESLSLPTHAPLMQFMPHTKPERRALKLDMRTKAPLFSCESNPSNASATTSGCLLLQRSEIPNCPNPSRRQSRQTRRAQQPCVSTIHGQSVGMAIRISVAARSSSGLAPRRGTSCVSGTTRGGRALATLGGRSADNFLVAMFFPARKAGAAVVRRGPAKHLPSI